MGRLIEEIVQADAVWLDHFGLEEHHRAEKYDKHMAVIHISEADAARNFAGLMAQVRAGAEIVIENGTYPAAVLRAAAPTRRSLSECIALVKKREEATGQAHPLNPDFAANVEEIVRDRQPWAPPAWD